MGIRTRSFANNILSGGVFDATDLDGALPSSNIADASVGNITAVPALVTTTTVASDPPSPDAGQIWYNTTDRVLRGYVVGAGSWASGGNTNSPRVWVQGHGTQTAAMIVSGNTSGTPRITFVEIYDGSSWTEVGDLGTGRYTAGSGGTTTAAIATGGYTTTPTALTETYNGTSWTEVGDLGTASYQNRVAGTQTAAITYGRATGVGPYSTSPGVESWDGTSWTEVAELNTIRTRMGGSGTSQTSAIAVSGTTGAYPVSGWSVNVENWNGTSWTELNNVNVARFNGGSGTSADTTIFFGGEIPGPSGYLTSNEEFDGTSWTEVNDLSTGRQTGGGAGNGSSALAISGTSPVSGATEEWSKSLATTTLGAS
jgi:hypothetical protein